MLSLDKGVFNEQPEAGPRFYRGKNLALSEELKVLCFVFLGSGCELTETETALSSVNIVQLELYMTFSNDVREYPLK